MKAFRYRSLVTGWVAGAPILDSIWAVSWDSQMKVLRMYRYHQGQYDLILIA